LFDFLRAVLSLELRGRLESEFVLRFQQFTSPVMAKGVEDTAFYCFNRLTSMCEVGGDPGRNGLSVEEFHQYQQTMQVTHPQTMTTLSTHDTKRSDDVRARLAVLTEIPAEFGEAVVRWAGMNAGFRTGDLPDRNSEYFYYQTLIGAWPIDAERAKAYMQKAMREAKQQTSWVANNKAYEDALNLFIEQTLSNAWFREEMERMVARVLEAGRINSLAQTLLKHTAPGVPDLYQGSELWDLSLVDPDNRRPVDYARRRTLLAEMKELSAAQVLARMDDGLPKLWMIHHALHLRKEHPEWFGQEAEYVPAEVTGSKSNHLVAYLRGNSVLTVVPRLWLTAGGAWGGTAVRLPTGRWVNRLTGSAHGGEVVLVKDLFQQFPVALLVREEQPREDQYV
jgi:(1->4)-alpha-D-glucan 1-alpha-D-glucosylmutase